MDCDTSEPPIFEVKLCVGIRMGHSPSHKKILLLLKAGSDLRADFVFLGLRVKFEFANNLINCDYVGITLQMCVKMSNFTRKLCIYHIF